ncbi:MAG: hypothetical protein WCE23_00950 [Candidatus Binatus sp.]|uniref:hypothetical protein n=1 Tax=Candidatus Binatus sp. TaxID=2811406 RepID=UPI003C794C41
MRLLRKSLPLILIASALLLSAASSEPTTPSPESASTSESERPQITQKANASQTLQSSGNPSVPPPIQTETPYLGGNKGNADTSAQKEATYTGLLVIVGALAIFVSALNYCASKSAADAARDSAKAAKAAVHQNRPFVLVKEIAHEDRGVTIYIVCDNAGTGPADIIEMMLAPQVFEAPKNIVRGLYVPPLPHYRPEHRLRIGDTVMRAGEIGRRFPVPVNFDDFGDLGDVRDSEGAASLWPALCGRITYRGGPPDETYETNFFYWYIKIAGEPLLFRGHDALNRRT